MTNPKLRFKKSDGSEYPDWEEKKLNNFIERSGKKNIKGKDLDIYSVNNIEGFIPQDDQFDKAGYLQGISKTKYQIVNPREFAYNPSRINVGSIGMLNENEPVLISPMYEVFKVSNKIVDDFLNHWLRTQCFQNIVHKYSVGSVRQTLKLPSLLNARISVPCLEEQQQIANFFSKIDETIKTTEKEVQDLELAKKGEMQKIFSQKVRFKASDGSEYPDWKEKKLNDIATCIKGANLSKADISDNGTPLILYGELYTTYSEVAKTIMRHTEKTVDEKFYSQGNEVLIPTSGENAKEISKATCVVPSGIILAGDLYILRTDVLNGQILSYILNHQANNAMTRLAQGMSIIHLKWDDLKNVIIRYPSDNREQQQIAEYLSHYDEAISAAKSELELWKKLKHGYMQRMFE